MLISYTISCCKILQLKLCLSILLNFKSKITITIVHWWLLGNLPYMYISIKMLKLDIDVLSYDNSEIFFNQYLTENHKKEMKIVLTQNCADLQQKLLSRLK